MRNTGNIHSAVIRDTYEDGDNLDAAQSRLTARVPRTVIIVIHTIL